MPKKKKSSGKKIKERKILKKPKRLPSYSPEKVLMKGVGKPALVREGRTGHFSDEYEEEIKWLS